MAAHDRSRPDGEPESDTSSVEAIRPTRRAIRSTRRPGQAKPTNLTYGSQFRQQARETFEVCVATNRTPYFYFEGEPHRDVLRKLADYERRYQVRAIIDVKPAGG